MLMIEYQRKSGFALSVKIVIIFIFISFLSKTPLMALESVVSQQGNQKVQEQQYNGVIECSGHILPDRQWTLYLGPSESVVKVMVKKGDVVEEGTPLVQLSNSALLERVLALNEKLLAIADNKDRIKLLTIKIEIAENSLMQLKKQIEEEKQINASIPDYLANGILKQWLREKKQIEDEISLAKNDLKIIQNQIKLRDSTVDLIEKNLSLLNLQLAQLQLKAPFPGRIIYLHKYVQRVSSAERILELWDDKTLKVKATVWQNQIQYVQPGYEARVFPNFYNKDFIKGIVHAIEYLTVHTEQNGLPKFPVIINLNQISPDLKIGMAVSVKIFNPNWKGLDAK